MSSDGASSAALEQESPSPEYVPDPIELENHVPVYVPEPDYPEYLASSDDDIPVEYQPLPADASPSSGDDDDDDDDVEEDEEEEEEHLAPADSTVVGSLTIDHVPSIPIPFPFEEEVARLLALPTPPPSPLLSPWSSPLPQILSPPLPVSSPPLPLPSPPPTSPTYTEAHLGYRGAGLRLRAALPPPFLPSIAQRKESLEADLPLWKRLCMTALTGRFKIGESSTATAARYVEPALARDDLYRFANTEIAPTTLEGVNERVIELATTMSQETQEIHDRLEDAQDDRALQRARVNTLFRDRRSHARTARLMETEARLSREA
ncbi:hypothetical protein Tco_0881016 [Tanacetum coccineum]